MSEPLPPVPGPRAEAEPLFTVGGLTAAAVAIVTLVATFVDIDTDTQSAILGVVAVAAPFVVAWLGRSRVFAPDTVRKMVQRAEGTAPTSHNTGPGY